MPPKLTKPNMEIYRSKFVEVRWQLADWGIISCGIYYNSSQSKKSLTDVHKYYAALNVNYAGGAISYLILSFIELLL